MAFNADERSALLAVKGVGPKRAQIIVEGWKKAKAADVGVGILALQRMGLPKSTVSRRLAALEQRLGERLLLRTTRRQTLTEFGREVVNEMNRLGMVIDVSHLSDAGFYDVARFSQHPFVASHSNARAVTGHSRNLTDDMIRVLAEKGGGEDGENRQPRAAGHKRRHHNGHQPFARRIKRTGAHHRRNVTAKTDD